MFKKFGFVALLIASVKVKADCFSTPLGYPCCSDPSAKVEFEDESGKWGLENGDWCGIPEPVAECWSEKQGYPCCPSGTEVNYVDESGSWGLINDEWCGISPASPKTCWSEALGFPCCKTTTKVEYTDESGPWGYENDDWCGIDKSTVTTKSSTAARTTRTTKKTTKRTTKKTTTTTTRKPRPTYSVIYEAGSRLNSGYDNWGWDSSLSFKDSSMVITADPETYGAASIKNTKGNFGKGGSVRLDVKSKGKVFIKVESTDDEEVQLIGTTMGDDDFTTYKFDIDVQDFPYAFDRINIQDGSGMGDPIYVRFLIYSNVSSEDFVDPVDTSYIPVVTTRKPISRAVYTTIFKSAYSMPSGYDNWGWGCSISYSGGAMVITPEEGEYGALSLKRINGYFKGGSLRFDMKNEGKVNVMVENSDTEEKLNIKSISASDTYQTYIIDVDFGKFDRINFQDAKGTGDRIWIKNLVHSTGYADDFVDPIN